MTYSRCSFFMEGCVHYSPLGRGGGGFSGFQVIGMIEWGQTSQPIKIPRASNKPPEIPGPKFNPPKIPCRIS